ncbi:MAG: polysaccharide biosynthesis protein, partial [Opitutales bacterium]
MGVQLIGRYLNLRTLALALVYAVLLVLSYFVAYELRFGFQVPPDFAMERVDTVWWVVLLKLMWLAAFGQVDCISAYFRLPDASRLFWGLFVSGLILAGLWYLYDGRNVPPRSVILADLLLGFFLLAGFRVLLRIQASRSWKDWLRGERAEKVLIVGAGEVGATLCSDLLQKTQLAMRPVAFVDDDTHKLGRYVHGIPVVDTVDALEKAAQRYAVDKIVIAFPSAPVKRVRNVAERARAAGLAVDIVPALTDLVSGRARMTQLHPVQLEDLLGREAVDLDSDEIQAMLAGKRVLVTGAGGSIGIELVKQIRAYDPARLLCVDQAEYAIFKLQQEVGTAGENLVFRIADICDSEAMKRLFREHRPEVVFHAAAHKHV